MAETPSCMTVSKKPLPMNLTKLFNFKFMKQMLKKAKGQIILLLSIIPIFTFLILLMSNTGSYYEILNLSFSKSKLFVSIISFTSTFE